MRDKRKLRGELLREVRGEMGRGRGNERKGSETRGGGMNDEKGDKICRKGSVSSEKKESEVKGGRK